MKMLATIHIAQPTATSSTATAKDADAANLPLTRKKRTARLLTSGCTDQPPPSRRLRTRSLPLSLCLAQSNRLKSKQGVRTTSTTAPSHSADKCNHNHSVPSLQTLPTEILTLILSWVGKQRSGSGSPLPSAHLQPLQIASNTQLQHLEQEQPFISAGIIYQEQSRASSLLNNHDPEVSLQQYQNPHTNFHGYTVSDAENASLESHQRNRSFPSTIQRTLLVKNVADANDRKAPHQSNSARWKKSNSIENDLANCMRLSRRFQFLAANILYAKPPTFHSLETLDLFLRTISNSYHSNENKQNNAIYIPPLERKDSAFEFSEEELNGPIILKSNKDKKTSVPHAQLLKRLILSSPTLSSLVTTRHIQTLIRSSPASLSKLSLANCTHLTSECLGELFLITPRLNFLDVSFVKGFTNETLHIVTQHCQEVEAINLSFTGVDCEAIILDFLKGYKTRNKSLKKLWMEGIKEVSDSVMVMLSEVSSELLDLNVAGTGLGKDTFTRLFCDGKISNRKPFCELRDLNLSDCKNLPTLYSPSRQLPVPALSTQLENLRDLNLSNMSTLEDEHLSLILSCTIKLRILTLIKCSALTDSACSIIAKYAKSLYILQIGHLPLLTDEGVFVIVKACFKLKCLDISHSSITDKAIEYVVSHNNRLKRLSVMKCTRLTDASLKHLARSPFLVKTLEKLNIAHIPQLTFHMSAIFASRCTSLLYLNLSGCTFLKDVQGWSRPIPGLLNESYKQWYCVLEGDGLAKLQEVAVHLRQANEGDKGITWNVGLGLLGGQGRGAFTPFQR